MTERVMVFAPHPDDVELFLGGSVLRHIASGDTLAVVMMTFGENGDIRAQFSPERRAACKQIRREELALRFSLIPTGHRQVKVIALDLPDGSVTATEEIVDRVVKELDLWRPACIYLPESTKAASRYSHPDHLATGLIAELAAERYRKGVVMRYFHSKSPNVFLDVSPYHQENLTALRCYQSQYSWATGIPFLLHIYEAVRYILTRHYGRRIGVKFAEGFRERSDQ